MPTGKATHGKLSRIQIGLPNNCIVTLTFTGTVTGGTFTLTFGGNTTGAITYALDPSVTAANIQTALVALTGIGLGNVGVFAFPSAPPYVFTIYLFNALGLTNQTLMTGAFGGLTGTSPGATLAGNTGSIVLLTGQSWDATDTAPEDEVTNFESGGGLSLMGIPRFTADVRAFFDTANNPQKNPPNIVRTDNGPAMTFFINRTLALAYFCPVTRIKDIKPAAAVDKAVTYGFNVASQGGYCDGAGNVVTI